ncbi:DUF4380 domain-containing protein [Larkinella insperata]|uniref:DUF4380 domain-containing protein n=1 Tax=Larkinella insperata TaxID=332158 RepID=A0ABW3QCU0_9BACT|nr:DUF4380 domain-containing protein [Larkinella insperata]
MILEASESARISLSRITMNEGQVYRTLYKGWTALGMRNQWLTLQILPQLGGRILQMTLDGYDFFFVNPALEGFEPDESRLGENGSWLNFGGEKIWPAPQGWDSPDSWPGPPDPVFDSGVFEVLPPEEKSPNRLTLRSAVDPYTGLQLTKAIMLSENRSEVVVEATFANRSTTPRPWSIWPVLQLNTPDWQAAGRYQVTSPMTPDRAENSGFRVLHGLVNNPQFGPDAHGNLVVNYQYLVGKVGLDSPANWVAFCDRQTGRVLVASATYQPGMPYPEGTSVQIWTQGRGQIYANHQVTDLPNDPQLTPPYLEMELLSPLKTMLPGAQLRFVYRMRACTVPAGAEVKTVNEFGVVTEFLKAVLLGETIQVTGQFGVFAQGEVSLQFMNEQGQRVHPLSGMASWLVDPRTAFCLDFQLPINELPAHSIAQVVLHFTEADNIFSGDLSHSDL